MARDPEWDNAVPLDQARAKLRQPNPNFVPHRLVNVINPVNWTGKDIPPRKWLVEGLIPMGNVTMLSGDGGLGKSLIALQLMVSCSTGKQWLGRSVTPCQTFGIFCEDDEGELHRRTSDICEANDLDLADLERVEFQPRVGFDNSLMDFEQYTGIGTSSNLLSQITEHVIQSGAQLVVLDSLHDLFVGNENIRSQARQFIGALRVLAQEIDGAVLLCSHPSASGLQSGSGAAGSTAWNNAVRSRLYLSRPKETDEDGGGNTNRRLLSTKKANYGPLGDDLALIWEDGILKPEQQATGVFKYIDETKADQIFINCLKECTKSGRYVADGRTSINFAPKVFCQMPSGRGASVKMLTKSMERLFASGAIKVDLVEGPSRRSVRALSCVM